MASRTGFPKPVVRALPASAADLRRSFSKGQGRGTCPFQDELMPRPDLEEAEFSVRNQVSPGLSGGRMEPRSLFTVTRRSVTSFRSRANVGSPSPWPLLL